MPDQSLRSLPELERWLSEALNREVTPTAFDLQPMQALLEAIDDPQQAFPVLQVAGTKGKGTTSAAAASILAASGLRVGLYTSPHLVEWRERIRLGPAPAPESVLLRAAARVRAAVDGASPEELNPSWFERVTAIACEAFRLLEVDVAVLEVGLGGRLDATSACDPAVSVITRIGLDHTAWLGETVAAIAAEKAAILRAGIPGVVDPVHPEAVPVVEAWAETVGAPLWWVGREVTVTGDDALTITTPHTSYAVPRPPLPPGPARANLALAVAACERLAAAQRWELTPRHVFVGLERLRWRGRQEWLLGEPPLLIDGAHEEASARALRQAYRDRRGERPFALLLAIAADKPIEAVVEQLAPGCAVAVCCRGGHPRAADPELLASRLQAEGVSAAACPGDSVVTALSLARTAAAERDLPLVVAGSLYLAGGVLAALGEDVSRLW
jgi:dihydrofolate synthase/folylpolyglutamate synthase